MIIKPSKLNNYDTDKDRQKALRAAPDAGRGAAAAPSAAGGKPDAYEWKSEL